jgi:CheY-like chemotaxis protein
MKTTTINLMLADDDDDDCFFFQEALNELAIPAHLTILPDGEKLMERLSDPSKPLPDLLFLDLNMPRKGGFECVVELKRQPRLIQIPVVILSTWFEKEMADRLYKIGVHSCLLKPASYPELKQVILQALALVKSATRTNLTNEPIVASRE